MTCTLTTYDIYGTHTPAIPSTHKPLGYFRIPRVNDVFLSPHGEVCTLEGGDVVPRGPRVIVEKEKVPTPASVYTRGPVVCPVGYTLGEFRLIKAGEMALADDGKSPVSHLGGFYRYILTPNPTALSVYGTETPKAPEGYRLGEFKKLEKGDDWLCPGEHGVCSNAWIVQESDRLWRYTLIPLPKAAPFTSKFKVWDKIIVNPRSSWSKHTYTVLSVPVVEEGAYGLQKEDGTVFTVVYAVEENCTLAPPPTTPTQPTKAPEGYYFTGEYRLPKKGDMFVYHDEPATLQTAKITFEASGNISWILLPLPPKPTIPGWEAVEFRFPVNGESYDSPGATSCGPVLAGCKTERYAEDRAFRWIMRPVTPPIPRWLIEVESEKEPMTGPLQRNTAKYVFDFGVGNPLKVLSITRKP